MTTTSSQVRFEPTAIRRTIVEMAYAASTHHLAPAFSVVEIFTVLYRSHVNLGNGQPESPGRDYLVLSKGHGVMAQYACMHELGWLTSDDLRRYLSDGTKLHALPDARVPGLEASCGSLGHGLPVGVGLAWGAKRRGTGQRVFVIVGDGELNEGSNWEALLLAAQRELSNLTVIVDNNGLQAMGRVEEILNMGSIAEKLRVFGLETREVNGHNEAEIDAALHELRQLESARPRAVVAKTVKGYGVSFMHDNNNWHYTLLTPETYAAALAELDGMATRNRSSTE